MQDADLVDRLLGEHRALAQGPAQVLLADPAALAAGDEELDRVALRRVGILHVLRLVPLWLVLRRLDLLWLGNAVLARTARTDLLAAFATVARPAALRTLRALTTAWPRRVLKPLLRALPLANRGLDVALDASDLIALSGGDEGDRAARAANPPRPPDAMDVGLG